MVADTLTNKIFIAEEDHGIWQYDIDPNSTAKPLKIMQSDPKNNKQILDDVEGLALYQEKNGSGYLVASSQGNNSYAFFDRLQPDNYIGSIVIASGKYDAVEETDGIEISSLNFGDEFPEGLFIAQDGFNYNDKNKSPQNFKIVNWSQIREILEKNKNLAKE
jgi:3-phytase